VTVDNLRVPQGQSCTLAGTTVQGTVKVERDATLTADAISVIGNVQAENARRVTVSRSRLGGSFQVKQGGGAEISNTFVIGDVQLDANRTPQRVASDDVNRLKA
jgi:hypothetical protein